MYAPPMDNTMQAGHTRSPGMHLQEKTDEEDGEYVNAAVLEHEWEVDECTATSDAKAEAEKRVIGEKESEKSRKSSSTSALQSDFKQNRSITVRQLSPHGKNVGKRNSQGSVPQVLEFLCLTLLTLH